MPLSSEPSSRATTSLWRPSGADWRSCRDFGTRHLQPANYRSAMSTATPPRILIADDQPDIIEALRLLLKGEGYQTEAVKSPAAVVKAIEGRDYAMVLMDLNYARDTTSGQEGLDLLQKIQTLDATLPVVVMTAWASVDVAVE